MLKNLNDKILSADLGKTTIYSWISAFVAIVFVRSFFETFSNHQYGGTLLINEQRAQYLLFFLATAFSIAFIVSVFTRQKGNTAINLILYGLPIIFLAPIIDLIANKGSTSYMDYLFDTHLKLLFDFITFLGPLHSNGATLGIRIEIIVIFCGLGWYVWTKSKSILSTLGALFAIYATLFLMGALPGIIYTVSHTPIPEALAPYALFDFMKWSVLNSNLPGNMLHTTFQYGTETRLLTFGFNSLMSQSFFILSFIFGMLWFWYAHKDIMMILMRNVRIERIAFYLALLTAGVLYAELLFNVQLIWVDWMGLIVLAISWIGAAIHATHTNDIADVNIDVISNPHRPLPRKEISVETLRSTGNVFLLVSLIGAYIVGYYPLFMLVVAVSAYYIYSAEPLRMKRIPMLSSFLIAIACLSTVLAGFFFLSPDKTISAFPISYAFSIVLIFTLWSNFRDIKDIEGDRALGIHTLPVVFGKHGAQATGALFALSFILVPYFFPFFSTYSLSIFAGFVGYLLCTKKPYNEKYIFVLSFVYCALSLLLV